MDGQNRYFLVNRKIAKVIPDNTNGDYFESGLVRFVTTHLPFILLNRIQIDSQILFCNF